MIFYCTFNFSSNRKDWGALIIVDDRFVRRKEQYCKGKLISVGLLILSHRFR